MSEGMVGGEGEEVAGGGAELVDEVRGLLAVVENRTERCEATRQQCSSAIR